MKHCESLLTLVCVTLLPAAASEALAVTAHLGGEVILPCQKENPNSNITQVQWDHMNPKVNHSYRILVFNPVYGVNISESALRDRVEVNEYSLRIKNVTMADEGAYTCRVAAFPNGVFCRTINLIVAESFQPSSAVIYATVAVVLLLGVLAAVAYLRRGSSVRCCAINPSSAVVDASRREDVVYAKVKLKTPRGSTSPSGHQRMRSASQDVTYAGLVF